MVPRDQHIRSAETLILEHLPDIVTLCNRMFVQTSDAQDATHEAVMAILRALPSYRGDGPVRHWLLKVALNAARNHRRKLARKTQREKPLAAPEVPRDMPPDPTEEREAKEALRTAIAELPEPLREAVTLSYYHGLTQVEIGGCVGCSQKTVHQRIKKGLEQLKVRLSGNAAMGALLVAPFPGPVTLDPVSASQVASVKQSIAAYYASAGGATAGTSPILVGEGVVASGIAAGGTLMQIKSYAGIALLAVTCLLGGAALSNQVFASGGGADRDSEVARLQALLDDGQDELQSLRTDLGKERRQGTSRVAELTRQLEALHGRLDAKDKEIADLREQAQGGAAGVPGEKETLSRTEQWEELEKSVSGVIELLRKMQEEGANQFELGPQLVAELGKMKPEQFEKLAAFDEKETDPEKIGVIRAVMLQAFTFVPSSAPLMDGYMERYLERTRNDGHGGFGDYALRRICFEMQPFVDTYAKVVAPLDDDLEREFLEAALERSAAGNSESRRLDGTTFLGRAKDPRATAELTRVFAETTNSSSLRLTALKGLAKRGDEDVLRTLRDAQSTETDPKILAEVEKATTRVEKLLAAKK